jgi:hypothetical protein
LQSSRFCAASRIHRPRYRLFAGDRLIVASYEGAIAALDARGTLIWRIPDANENEPRATGRIFRLLATGGTLVVAREYGLEWIDPADGAIVNTLAEPGLLDIDAAGSTIYALNAAELATIVDGRVVARQEAAFRQPRPVDGCGRRHRLELLNATSGELIAAWPALNGIASVAVSGEPAAAISFDGSIWTLGPR